MKDESLPLLPTSKDRRWRLPHALGWILTRDVERVVELAPNEELIGLIMAFAIWRTKGVPLHADPNSAMAELAQRIAAGDVTATGRKFRDNLNVGGREHLELLVDGFVLGDLYSSIPGFPGVNLEDMHSSDRIVDIAVEVPGLLAAFPAEAVASIVGKSKGGRPPKFPWPEIGSHFLALLDDYGCPNIQNERWRNRAALTSELIEFVGRRYGEEPSPSVAKSRVAEMIKQFERARAALS